MPFVKFNRSSLPFAVFPTLLFFGLGRTLVADPEPTSVSAGRQSLPTLSVEATYPGADSQVVADTVATAIEQQVIGTEGLLHMYSRSAGDGTYVLHLTFRRGNLFRRGTDLDVAQVLVQNRVSLALPVLPDAVQRAGVTVKKRSPCPLMLAVLFSPDFSRDALWLSNYATIQIRDELLRVPGVADVAMLGAAEYGMQVWLDPEKMTARNLTAADVIGAIEQQNVQVAAGRIGQPPDKGRNIPITVQTMGRLVGPEEFGDVIVKVGEGGRMVRLKDVARVELGTDSRSRRAYARLDGKPAVTLAVFPIPQADPREVSAAVGRKLSELRSRFPHGIDLCTRFDFTAGAEAPAPAPSAYLLVEAALPSGASPERTQAVLGRCRGLLQGTEGVKNVLELSDVPFGFAGSPPCLLVRAAARVQEPGREDLMRTIRGRLAHIEGAAFRLCDLTNPNGYPPAGFPVDLAICGPEAGPVREAGQRLIERLRRGRELLDVGWDSRHVPTPQLSVDIDRTKAATLGVPLGSVFDTLQAFLGSRDVGQFSSFGRTWQVRVEFSANDRNRVEDVGKLKIRGNQGNMVSLATLATIRETVGIAVRDRLDGRPMVEITANPAPGVSLAEARWLCEKAAEEVLGAEYRLTWLSQMPPPKPVDRAETILKPGAAHAAPEVAVVLPVVREIKECVDCTGRTQAVSTVDVRARITGYLDKVQFQDGSDVKKGTVLFEIDSRPYQAELAKADAEVLRCDARRQRAQSAVRRAERLVATKAMSQEDFDLARGELEDAQALIRVARAGLNIAKLNLDYSKVAAPLDGRIGRCLVTPGNLVKADETLLATIVSRNPMFVYFDLDERTALRLMHGSRAPAAIPAMLGLADEEGYPRKGTVDFVDNRVDADTGTLKVRAVLSNADGALVPGLFVRIRLPTGGARKALLVPEQAIQADQGEKFLYVIDNENKVARRNVTVGAIQDGLRIVEKGLQPRDRVVIGGLQMVLPGMTVTPQIQEGK